MKDITKDVLKEYWHEIKILKTAKSCYERYLRFQDVQDVLDNYNALNNNKFESSISNLINYKIKSMKNSHPDILSTEKLSSSEIRCKELRQTAYGRYIPKFPNKAGQLDDVRIEYNDEHPTFESVNRITIYDNVFNSIDGLIINDVYNNYQDLEIAHELFENRESNQLYRIQFLGLPTTHYDKNGRVLISQKLLLLTNIEKQDDYEEELF